MSAKKMKSKVGFVAICMVLFTVFGAKFIAADKEFDVVPKLYEEIGCSEINGDGGLKR